MKKLIALFATALFTTSVFAADPILVNFPEHWKGTYQIQLCRSGEMSEPKEVKMDVVLDRSIVNDPNIPTLLINGSLTGIELPAGLRPEVDMQIVQGAVVGMGGSYSVWLGNKATGNEFWGMGGYLPNNNPEKSKVQVGNWGCSGLDGKTYRIYLTLYPIL